MAEGARVDSIDVIKGFKPALVKFAEAINVALGDAESEIHRTLVWLEAEQSQHWRSEIRKRQTEVARAREAVRMKKLYKDSSGRTVTAIDEEKALAVALRKLQEAEQKALAVKKWSLRLQKEMEQYKGGTQSLATAVQSDVPAATARLDALFSKLESYVSMGPAAVGSEAVGSDAGQGMSRPAEAEESMARPAQESVAPAEQEAKIEQESETNSPPDRRDDQEQTSQRE